ncbi:hypothetical protein B0H10DRAFT_1973774 [Mycena sp. CBHHK59/15]|nr:hypothetical protein B0H10DRAFT_1973774 [Mycena sp. CBHHK59/15]
MPRHHDLQALRAGPAGLQRYADTQIAVDMFAFISGKHETGAGFDCLASTPLLGSCTVVCSLVFCMARYRLQEADLRHHVHITHILDHASALVQDKPDADGAFCGGVCAVQILDNLGSWALEDELGRPARVTHKGKTRLVSIEWIVENVYTGQVDKELSNQDPSNR